MTEPRRTPPALLAALVAAMLPGLPAARAGAEPSVPVEQVVRGVPGLKGGETLRQRLWIARDKLRLEELIEGTGEAPVYLPRFLLRADQDPAVIYELLFAEKAYRQWEELQNIQRDRKLYELQVLERTRSLPEEDRTRARAAYHLREGGRREVSMREEPAPPVTVGGKAYPGRRVVITENDLEIVDAFVTDQIGLGLDYYRFYRQLGVFSDEVLAQLKEVKGFPLTAKLCVVTGKLKGFHTLQIEVAGIGAEEALDSSFFEVPPGWRREEKPLTTTCAAQGCEAQVEPLNPAGGKFTYQGRTYYFCSRECWKSFIDDQKRVIRARRAALGPPAPPKSE